MYNLLIARRKPLTGRIIFASLFAASIVFLIMYGDDFLIFERPDTVSVHSPALAVKDAPGNMYVVDSSRKRLFRVSASGRLDLLLHAQKANKVNENGFSEIYDLAVDADGGIFIIDTVRDPQIRRIQSEAVRRYSPDGRLTQEIFRVDHESPTFNRSIAGLAQNAEGGVSFVTLEKERFVLHSHTSGKKSEITYDFPMASRMFNFFDVGQDGLVLFTTRRGEIYKADDKPPERIFASASSIPWDAAVGNEGLFYFTDIARRGVYSLAPDGKSEVVYDGGGTIYYRFSAKNGFVAISENTVIDLGGPKNSVFGEFTVSGGVLAMRLCSWFTLFVFSAGCIWGLIVLARFLAGKNSFVIKFSAVFTLGVMFVMVVFYLIVTKDVTNRMTREMLNRMTNVAELIAMQIPQNAFGGLNGVGDYMNEDYTAVSGMVKKIMSQTEFAEMYCVLYKLLDGAVAEVFESDNNHGIVNYPYDWPLDGSDEMEIIATGQYKTYIYPSWVDGGVIFSLCPVYGKTGETIGLIEIGTDLAAFKSENQNLVINLFLNVISMSVAIIIVVVEFLVFLAGRRKMRELSLRHSSCVPVDMMRGAVFLVYFVTNVGTSFVPIYTRTLILEAGISMPFPTEFLIALPISSDVFLGMFAALLGDWFIKRFGLRRTAMIGGLTAAGGACLTFAFYNFFTLVAGFAVCGFGCGLVLFIANLRMAGEKNPLEKDRGFAGTTVAMSSGVNGGVVFGAFLVNWLSHRAVLGIAGLVSLLLLAFSYTYMTKLESSSLKSYEEGKEISAAKFLSSPRVFLYFLTLLGPAIASGYFIIYLFPIVGFDFGISESNIGYAFLLNSLVVIFFSSTLTNVFSKKFGKTLSLSLWALIYAGSFALFANFQNIPVLLSVLVLMGFADCFGQSLSTSYYTELPEVEKYGHGKAIGVLNVADNVAQAIGPFVFSYVLHVGLTEGLMQVAAGLVALSLIFILGAGLARGKRC